MFSFVLIVYKTWQITIMWYVLLNLIWYLFILSFFTVFKIVILKALRTLLDLCYTLQEHYADLLEG